MGADREDSGAIEVVGTFRRLPSRIEESVLHRRDGSLVILTISITIVIGVLFGGVMLVPGIVTSNENGVDSTNQWSSTTTDPGIWIDLSSSNPSRDEYLQPGETYTFDIEVVHEYPAGETGTIKLYFESANEYVDTVQIEGTGAKETVTMSATETVPEELSGETFYMSVGIWDDNGDLVVANDDEYDVAYANPDGDIWIDGPESSPPTSEKLEPGKSYTFEIDIPYTYSEGNDGLIQLYFEAQDEYVASEEVQGTGTKERITLVTTETVPEELSGEQFYMSVGLWDHNGDLVAANDDEYDVALADPEGNLWIDGEASNPPTSESLEAGENYTFEIETIYEYTDGRSGTLQLYFEPLNEYVATQTIEGTGTKETTTLTTTETVPEEMGGDEFYMSVSIFDENGDYVSGADDTYYVDPGENTPPTIDAVEPANDSLEIQTGESRSFWVESSDDDGDNLTHTWYLDDTNDDDSFFQEIGSDEGTTSTLDRTFEEASLYSIKVEVSDGNATDDHNWLVEVSDPNEDRPPTIDRTTPNDPNVTIAEGDDLLFEATVSDPDEDLDTVEWFVDSVHEHTRFLGGGSPQTDDFEHTFSETGEYTVRATVNDSLGNSDSVEWSISVEANDTTDASGDVSIDTTNLDPDQSTDLVAGERFEFEVPIQFQYSADHAGTIAVEFPDAGAGSITQDIEGTGNVETTTVSDSVLVPERLATETFKVEVVLRDGSGNPLAVDRISYPVTRIASTAGVRIDGEEIQPSLGHTLDLGETYPFTVPVEYEYGSGLDGTVRLYINGSDEPIASQFIEGTGETEQYTFSVNGEVPDSVAGTTLRLRVELWSGNSDRLGSAEVSYNVTGDGDNSSNVPDWFSDVEVVDSHAVVNEQSFITVDIGSDDVESGELTMTYAPDCDTEEYAERQESTMACETETVSFSHLEDNRFRATLQEPPRGAPKDVYYEINGIPSGEIPVRPQVGSNQQYSFYINFGPQAGEEEYQEDLLEYLAEETLKEIGVDHVAKHIHPLLALATTAYTVYDVIETWWSGDLKVDTKASVIKVDQDETGNVSIRSSPVFEPGDPIPLEIAHRDIHEERNPNIGVSVRVDDPRTLERPQEIHYEEIAAPPIEQGFAYVSEGPLLQGTFPAYFSIQEHPGGTIIDGATFERPGPHKQKTWTHTLGTLPGGVIQEYEIVLEHTDTGEEVETLTVRAKGTGMQSPIVTSIPNLNTVLEVGESGGGILKVTSETELEEPPVVEVEGPDDTDIPVEVTRTQDEEYTWVGEFEPPASGLYSVTATGQSSAGIEETDRTTANLQLGLDTVDRTMVIENEETGTFIRFETAQAVEDTHLAISESDLPHEDLEEDMIGLNFLTAQLDGILSENLDVATIGVPADEARLPEGVDVDDVSLSHYNESADRWESLDTRLEEVDISVADERITGAYWVTTVDHFSTYGAVVVDDDPPQLEAVTPADETFDSDTDEIRVRFEFSDELLQIDQESIAVRLNGEDVTDSPATVVNDSAVELDVDAKAGERYFVEVAVSDLAGNTAQFQTEFEIQPKSQSDQSTGSGTVDGSGSSSESTPDDAHAGEDEEESDENGSGFTFGTVMVVLVISTLFAVRAVTREE